MIALMIGITIVSGALTQYPVGRISDRTDRRYVIVGAAIAAALAGLTILILKPTDPSWVIPLVAIYGGMTYPIYGLAVAHANDYAEASDFVAVSGGLLLLYGFGTDDRPARRQLRHDRDRPAGDFPGDRRQPYADGRPTPSTGPTGARRSRKRCAKPTSPCR